MVWFKSRYKQTDTKDRITSFTQAGTRENIRSGEKHKTLFGKIAKYFSDLKPVAFTGSYNDLQDKPSNLAPAAHRHSKSDITDFPSSLPASDVYSWAKASSKPSYTWSDIGGKPSTFAPASHTHSNYATKADPAFTGIIALNYGGRIKCMYANRLDFYTISNTNCTEEEGVFISSGVAAEGYSSFYGADNACSCGSASQRWRQVYAVNSSISTSDRNEKKEISYIGWESNYEDTNMTDGQLIQLILGLKPVVFKRINGDSGRPHHGIIAQDFEELLKEIGLHDHAAFIKSPKMVEIEDETEKEVPKEILQEDGTVKIITEKIKEKIVRQEVVPGEYIYGIRYEELEGDIIRFCQILYQQNQEQQKKIEDLENRVNMLENIIKQGA